jgi:Cys-tRNA(Pro)/Cys-tRNA(Cys) deacylase
VTDDSEGYGIAAAKALGVPPERVFKTLMVSFDQAPKALGVCIVPVAHNLNLKQAAKAHGHKSAAMADPKLAEKVTGYLVGGISPIAQKRALPTVLDQSAERFDAILVSGGKRGLDIELAPSDLITLCRASLASLAA